MSETTPKNSVFFGGWCLPPDTARAEGSSPRESEQQMEGAKWQPAAELGEEQGTSRFQEVGFFFSFSPPAPQYLFWVFAKLVSIPQAANPEHPPRTQRVLETTPTAQCLSGAGHCTAPGIWTPRSQEATSRVMLQHLPQLWHDMAGSVRLVGD